MTVSSATASSSTETQTNNVQTDELAKRLSLLFKDALEAREKVNATAMTFRYHTMHFSLEMPLAGKRMSINCKNCDHKTNGPKEFTLRNKYTGESVNFDEHDLHVILEHRRFDGLDPALFEKVMEQPPEKSTGEKLSPLVAAAEVERYVQYEQQLPKTPFKSGSLQMQLPTNYPKGIIDCSKCKHRHGHGEYTLTQLTSGTSVTFNESNLHNILKHDDFGNLDKALLEKLLQEVK